MAQVINIILQKNIEALKLTDSSSKFHIFKNTIFVYYSRENVFLGNSLSCAKQNNHKTTPSYQEGKY